ncbi:unannotated protein [freshwater metagenome]|uniref:Unannotated protein n=1 Tax=freshwater metagenome TaxID=449393 RepID=A0A6J7RAZ3_9ZZZZ
MPDIGGVGEFDELLDETLAAVVGRVRLAGDDELDGPLGIEEQGTQPVLVTEHEGQSLVRRHSPGKADGEDIGVENRVDPAEFCLCGAAAEPRLA